MKNLKFLILILIFGLPNTATPQSTDISGTKFIRPAPLTLKQYNLASRRLQCQTAHSRLESLQEKLSREISFCRDYDQAVSDLEKLENAKFVLSFLATDCQDADCRDCRQQVQDDLQSQSDSTEATIRKTEQTCSPHRQTISDLKEKNAEAAANVCKVCLDFPEILSSSDYRSCVLSRWD